ncbi:hypothetical protein LCGC14_0365170 [marine sediment metagenome]|uniref:DUF551 domain-containing protein n=1 Tax=marine sediment metagenome TaxID=412755 RepID=A0A0F9T719_9ZZZZ
MNIEIEKKKREFLFNWMAKGILEGTPMYEKAMVALTSLLQENWTSVEDELPKKAGKYIVCHKKGIIPRVEETEITKSLIPLLKHTSITHWQPLPEKPKED